MTESKEISEVLPNTKIYHGDEFLNITTETELALYFPYIIWMGYWDKEHGVIRISQTDYIRRREIESLDIYRSQILREKARIRKRKLEYNPDAIFDKLFGKWYDAEREMLIELIARFEHKNKVDMSDIRLRSREWERNIWYTDLVEKYGYDNDFARDWVWHLGDYKDV